MNENFYKRLKELSAIDKTKTSSTSLNAMTLVDFKRADDGTALGIIKENHNYYIKTSKVQGDKLTAADFAYIGGIENKRKYQFESLSKAEKQREFHMASLNEAFSFREKDETPEKKISLNEATKLQVNESIEGFLKKRISEGKKTLIESTQDKFKKNLKPTEKSNGKKGLLPEQADFAIRKALGKLNESEVLATADSQIADADMVDNKTGKDNATAPVNDTNAKTKANLGHAQPSDLVTSDSEIADGDKVANKNGGKETPEAPVNDTNAKTKANLGHAQPSDLVTSDSEIEMSDSVIGLENADMKVSTEAVFEGKVVATADSEIKKSDAMSEKKGKESAQAPVNDTNAKAKSKLGTAQPSDLVTSDSEIKMSDSVNEDIDVENLDTEEGDTADAELDAAAKALDDLEIADASNDTEVSGDNAIDSPMLDTPAEPAPAAPATPAPAGDMAAAAPTPDMGGEELAGDMGAAAPTGDAGLDMGAEGGEEPTADAGLDMGADADSDMGEDGDIKKVEKLTGKLDNAVRNTEITSDKTTALLNQIISSFGDKLAELDPEERKEIATKIVKAEKEEGDESADEMGGDEMPELDAEANEAIDGKVASLKENGFDDEDLDDEMSDLDAELGISADDKKKAKAAFDADSQVEESEFGDDEDLDDEMSDLDAELGISADDKKKAKTAFDADTGFNNYLRNRGYEGVEECSEQEMASVVSGWATDHADGENDGDYKTVAIYLTPAIQKELEDAGHGDFIEKLKAVVGEIGEDQLAKFGSVEPMPDAEENMDDTEEESGEEETEEKPEMGFAPAGDILTAKGEEESEEEESGEEESEEESEEEETEDKVEESKELKGNQKKLDKNKNNKLDSEDFKMMRKEKVDESTEKLKKYIKIKIEEKLGLRKPVLAEGKKTATSVLIERMVEEELGKLTEAELQEISLGGLFSAGKKIGNMASGAAQKAYSAVETKIQGVANNIKAVGDEIAKSYHAGAKNAVVDDIERMAVELGQLIAKLNASAVKAGEQPINPKSILATIQNQISAAKPAQPAQGQQAKPAQPQVNLSKFRTK